LKIPYGRWIAALTLAGIAITLLARFYSARANQGEKAERSAESEVYATVVHEMIAHDGGIGVSQLVFDQAVLTNLTEGEALDICREKVRKQLRGQETPPPYNSLADKMCRLLNFSSADDSLRPDTVQDFATKSCSVGPLAREFQTAIPRAFIESDAVAFGLASTSKDGPTDFSLAFSGAGGIISLSRVGFDRNLRQAIVSTSLVCGMLCGSRRIYALGKVRGQWQVVRSWVIWVS
jgi:hypothetical protein